VAVGSLEGSGASFRVWASGLPAEPAGDVWILLQVAGESFDRAEGLAADMMLETLDVVGDDGLGKAELAQKRGEEFVTMGDA
jgi:hypothetical protein